MGDGGEWRDISCAPGYKVSDRGDVIGRRGNLLKPFVNRGGYIVHTFWVEGRAFKRTAHTLVCEAFNGPRPNDKLHCAHRDGDKSNNTPSNLRWASAGENAADGLRLGEYKLGSAHWSHTNPEKMARGDRHGLRANPDRANRGEDRYNAKLTNDQATLIRSAPRYHGVVNDLARELGVSVHVIRDVRRGRSYRSA